MAPVMAAKKHHGTIGAIISNITMAEKGGPYGNPWTINAITLW